MKYFVCFSLVSFLAGVLAFCANSQSSSEGLPSASLPEVPSKDKEISYAETADEVWMGEDNGNTFILNKKTGTVKR